MIEIRKDRSEVSIVTRVHTYGLQYWRCNRMPFIYIFSLESGNTVVFYNVKCISIKMEEGLIDAVGGFNEMSQRDLNKNDGNTLSQACLAAQSPGKKCGYVGCGVVYRATFIESYLI